MFINISVTSDSSKFKSACCIPYFVIVIFVVLCIGAAGILLQLRDFGSSRDNNVTTISNSIKDTNYTSVTIVVQEKNFTAIDSVLIALAVIVGVVIISNVYRWAKIGISLCRSSRSHLHKLVSKLNVAHLEGYISSVKREVELIAQMTRCLDAFLGIQSRLVLILDGLDSCEQEKLLQVTYCY